MREEPYAYAYATAPQPSGAGPSGVGGWLVVGVISLVVTGLLSITKAFLDIGIMDTVAKAGLSDPGSAFYVPSTQPLLVFDSVARAVLFVACIVAVVMFFRKRPALPRLVAGLYGAALLVTVVALVAGIVARPALLDAGFPEDGDALVIIGAVAAARAALLAVFWIPYYLVSTRVKSTFTRGWVPSSPESVGTYGTATIPPSIPPTSTTSLMAPNLDLEEAQELDETAELVTGSGYIAKRSLRARPELIKRAADEWASCSNWFPSSEDPGAPVYCWGRFRWLTGNTRIAIVTQEQGGTTETWFEIGLMRRDAPHAATLLRDDYARAAECFADGVSNELAFQTMALPPAELERWASRRERARRINGVEGAVSGLVAAAFIPVLVAVGLLNGSASAVFAALTWLSTIAFLNYYLRVRHMGMRAVGALIPIALFFAVAVGLTLAAAFGAG